MGGHGMSSPVSSAMTCAMARWGVRLNPASRGFPCAPHPPVMRPSPGFRFGLVTSGAQQNEGRQ
eukprot:7684089-Pyramimonas_sp.AAC.1